MKVLKIIGKVLAFPVMLVVMVIQWLFTFLISFSSIVFNLLAGLLLLVAALSQILGIMTWTDALKAVLAGFIVFMIPIMGQGITAIVAVFREELSNFIWS